MPYRLEQSGAGYYVVGPSGRHSRKPMSRSRAVRQMRALYAVENKDAGATAGTPLSGPGGLLGTPGLGRSRKWGNRTRNKACTCGVNIATKEQIAPGITRIRGNLCNVHGRYGPCDAAASGKKPKGKKGAGRTKKPKKPVLTPEQRAAEHQKQQAANRAKILGQLNIAPDGQAALEALRNGQQPPDVSALARGGFEKAGLVERAADGSYRLTVSGRATLNAASQGDVGRAGDAISAARDRLSAHEGRQSAAQQRKQAAEERRKQAAAERAKKQASRGSGKQGSSGGSTGAASADRIARERERQSDRAQRLREHAEDRARRLQEHEQDRARRAAEREQGAAPREPQAQRASQLPRVSSSRPGVVRPTKAHGRSQRVNIGTRTKAQTPSERAMFAKLGGGTGGGGKGSSGSADGGGDTAKKGDYSGENKLWPKDPKTGRREDPEGLFGRSYHERQAGIQARAGEREAKQRASDAEREAFFKRQSEARTTTAPISGPKIVNRQQSAAVTTSHSADAKTARYHELEQSTQRVKMPQPGWNAPMSGAQKNYLGNLADRARLNTKEGTPHRAIIDEIIRMNKAGTLTKWEASQFIDLMQNPKPMTRILESAKSGIHNSRSDDPWRAMLASPSFRYSLIGRTLNDEADAEGLPF